MQHHWALKHYPWTPLLKSKAEGLAILTPHTLSATGSASLTPNCSDWSYKRRIVVWGLVERPDHSAYRVYDAHLIGGDAADDRLDQAQRVAALVAEHGGAPVVVAGDFNDSDEPAVDRQRSPGSRARQPPRRTRPTHRRQRIDHVLVPDAADRHHREGAGGWRRVGRLVRSPAGDDDVHARLGRGRLPGPVTGPEQAQAFLATLAGLSTPFARASSR